MGNAVHHRAAGREGDAGQALVEDDAGADPREPGCYAGLARRSVDGRRRGRHCIRRSTGASRRSHQRGRHGRIVPVWLNSRAARLPVRPITGEASIPSNFNVQAVVVPDNTGAIPLPELADASEGAFRFVCSASHEAYDDPIVYPGQPGKSHLHEFFGNSLTNASSTYQSLRTTGDSSCLNAANRSAYWMPAMMNSQAKVVRPDVVTSITSVGPQAAFIARRTVQAQGTACVAFPRGLPFVFGFNMQNPGVSATDVNGGTWFNCAGPTADPGQYKTLVEAAQHCPVGNQIGAVITAPNCWDGKNLNTADHRSHMAYGTYGQNDVYLHCPKNHPYVVPAITLGAWFTVDSDTAQWRFSSDNMPGMETMAAGTTFHADYFESWDDNVMKTWMDNCIDKGLNCQSGQPGDGTILQAFAGFSFIANPHLVIRRRWPWHVAAGGWGGIRTHGELAPTAVFKTAALNHSATSPCGCRLGGAAAVRARRAVNRGSRRLRPVWHEGGCEGESVLRLGDSRSSAAALAARSRRPERHALSPSSGLSEEGFQAYLPQLRAQALARRASAATTIDERLPDLTFSAAYDRARPGQPGGTAGNSASSAFRALSRAACHAGADRARAGRAMPPIMPRLHEIEPPLRRRPSILVAIWGHETSYGAVTGNFDLLNSLASLAYEGRRRELFDRRVHRRR